MKVLAGADGSQKSLDAIQFAARLLDPSRDAYVFYYSPPEIHISREDELMPAIPAELREQLIQDVFDKTRAVLPVEFRDQLDTVVGQKKPAAGLLLAAEQVRADLIVLGADTKHRTLGPFLGGVARCVARDASVPVLVFRHARDAGELRPLHVLLAHDGSAAATSAGQQLSRLNWPGDTTGTIVRVMSWIDIRVAGDPRAPTLWRDDYERYVKDAKTRAAQALLNVSEGMPAFLQNEPPLIEEGAAVEALCDLATTKHSDLIVVGPHNRGITRRVFGATTESLLHYAPCSVLVWHQPEIP
jgi:nucleotide-binding universal stress UspA family protein